MTQSLIDKIVSFLRWTQKYTKTDMVYLAKGGFWLSLGQVISSLAGLLMAIVFANWVPKEVYGKYKYALSIIGLLNIFTLSGLNAAINRTIARGYEASFFPALKLKIKCAIIGSIISIGIAFYYLWKGNYEFVIIFLIIAVGIPLLNPLMLYQAILIGKKQFKQLSQYKTTVDATNTLVMVLFIVFTKNIILIIFAYLASYIVLRFIFLRKTVRLHPLNNKKESGVMSYGLHLSAMGIIDLIGGQIDKILVYKFIGVTPLAIYAFATEIPEKIRMMLKNVNILVSPKFSKNYEQRTRKDIRRKTYLFLIFLAPIIITYILTAPMLWKLLFPKYTESVYYSQLYVLSLFSIPFINIGMSFMTAQKYEKALYYINTFGAIFKILIIFVGIYYWGIIGLVLARVFYQMVLSITIHFYPEKS